MNKLTEFLLTLDEVRRGVSAFPPDVLCVLLRSIQDMQSCLHCAYQLISAIPPHRSLLWVPGQPRLQLVHPEAHSKNPHYEEAVLH